MQLRRFNPNCKITKGRRFKERKWMNSGGSDMADSALFVPS